MQNRSFFRKVILILITAVICGIFSGCFDAKEIDDFAYVTAIGFDKGRTNFLKMTIQMAVGKNIGGGASGGGGGGEEKPYTVTTVETPSIYSGLNMMNTYISKELNVSHAKAIVISEELAREGIHHYIHALIRGRQFRPNTYVVISRGSAEDYIKNVEPELETNPSKFYDLNYRSYQYTGFTANSTLINFYLQEECTCSQAVANLGAVTRFESSEDFDLQGSTYREKGRDYPLEGDFKAGDMPKVGKMKSEIFGLAVFDGGRMMGTLDGAETLYYLMLTGQYDRSFLTIPDPFERDKIIVLNVKQNRNPVKRVKMVGESPNIYAKLIFEADIVSIQTGRNYESIENYKVLEKAAQDFLREGATRFLIRTAEELGSDVCAFGKAIKGSFITWEQWDNFDWLDKYKDASFNVDVELKIRRPGLMIRTEPAYSTKGKEYKN